MSLLRGIPLFQSLGADEFEKLSRIMEDAELADGELLFRQGDASTHVYIVRRGTVQIFATHDGVREDYTTLTVGGIFGEIGVMKGAARTASAVAVGPVQLIVMEGEAFRNLVEECPNVGSMVLQTMFGRFRADRDRAARRASRPKTRGRIVPVFSATGGAGTSLVVANLAGLFRELTKKRVAVLDLDLMFGDQGPIFGLEGGFTLSEILMAEAIDAPLLQEIARETKAGVDVFLAPARPEEGEFVAPGFVERVLSVLAEQYDYLLCDTPRRLYEVTLDLFERAATPILVVTPEVTSVRHAARWIDVLQRIGLPLEGLKLIANKVTDEDAKTMGYVKSRLKGELVGTLPFDPVARTSINLGELVTRSAPASPLGGALRKTAGALLGLDVADASSAGSFWRRWM